MDPSGPHWILFCEALVLRTALPDNFYSGRLEAGFAAARTSRSRSCELRFTQSQLITNHLLGDERVSGGKDWVFFEPAAIFVCPGAVGVLEVDQLQRELFTPVDFAA